MKKSSKKFSESANWILLGLLMLVPGLLKLFSFTPAGVTAMLSGLGFPIPGVFAWILIVGEIGSGIALLAKWQTKYVVYIPMIILTVAAFTTFWGSWSIFLLHIVAVANYWVYAQK